MFILFVCLCLRFVVVCLLFVVFDLFVFVSCCGDVVLLLLIVL